MSTVFECFEALGFRLGLALATRRARRRVAPSAPPRAPRPTRPPPSPALARGDRVAFAQDGSVVVGQVVRVAPGGRVVVAREPDGKRFTKRAADLRGVTRLPPGRRRAANRSASSPAQPAGAAGRPAFARPPALRQPRAHERER